MFVYVWEKKIDWTGIKNEYKRIYRVKKLREIQILLDVTEFPAYQHCWWMNEFTDNFVFDEGSRKTSSFFSGPATNALLPPPPLA